MKKSDIERLEEKVYTKKTIYKGKAISFRVDEVILPNKKIATREFMDHPGAVGILAVENDSFVFVRQCRYPVGKITYEIPAGKLYNKKDDFLKRAKVELKEETGYSAKKWCFLLDFWPTPAFSNEVLKIYLAEDLIKGKNEPDDDEFVNIEKINIKKAVRMIESGEIKDSKTIIAILYYVFVFSKR